MHAWQLHDLSRHMSSVVYTTLHSSLIAVLLSPTYQRSIKGDAILTTGATSITDAYTYVQCRSVLATRSFARDLAFSELARSTFLQLQCRLPLSKPKDKRRSIDLVDTPA
uniref:Uncharacterized protein n=1 Tax=Arundo donax TaxID=35708 RepID=A0A0A8YDE4_ARUDO